MLGVCGIFGGSSPQDGGSSLQVVDALQRGQRSPDDLLRSLYHSLQAFGVHSSSAAMPCNSAAGQCSCGSC